MIALSDQMRIRYEESRLGEEDIMVAETYDDGYTTGYTSDYICVRTEGQLPHGQMVRVHLEEIRDGQMYARKV